MVDHLNYLQKSFELQNFDIVNAERKQHGLKTLDYSKDVSHTARKHSIDMVKHNYFDHVNEKKLSPFDRLKKMESNLKLLEKI